MLTMVTLPDERLFQVSRPVTAVDGKLVSFVDQMFETMHTSDGIGLAGVQVGLMDRLFIVQIPDEKPLVFINPRIEQLSDHIVGYEEGCLSIPGIYSDVQRPDKVRVSAIGRDGNEFTLDAEGLLARVIQHEYDHLEGKLFYQNLRPRQQARFLKACAREHGTDLDGLIRQIRD